MSSLSRQQLEGWLKTLTNIKGRILDIGGSQNPIVKRLSNTELYIDDYKILDLETPHEVKVKPDIVCDMNKDETWVDGSGDIQGNNKGKIINIFLDYDIVFCLEVSEYWWNPLQALKNIYTFLKKGGILYISFHFVYMQHAPKGTDFLRYTPDGAEKLLKEAGFEILEHKHRMAESELLQVYYSQDKMRGIKDGSVDHNIIGSLIKCKKL